MINLIKYIKLLLQKYGAYKLMNEQKNINKERKEKKLKLIQTKRLYDDNSLIVCNKYFKIIEFDELVLNIKIDYFKFI